jgi:hypothetical protein
MVTATPVVAAPLIGNKLIDVNVEAILFKSEEISIIT